MQAVRRGVKHKLSSSCAKSARVVAHTIIRSAKNRGPVAVYRNPAGGLWIVPADSTYAACFIDALLVGVFSSSCPADHIIDDLSLFGIRE